MQTLKDFLRESHSKITRSFTIAAKPLLKKYHSLSKDLLKLEKELIVTPRLGTSLGQDVYKIRLRISSKGKGKSGGARVISFVETTLIGITEKIYVFLALLLILPIKNHLQEP